MRILKQGAEESLGGCLMLVIILVGLVGVPLGGWGIPILVGVGFWYLIESQKENQRRLAEVGAHTQPRHVLSIQKMIDSLATPYDQDLA